MEESVKRICVPAYIFGQEIYGGELKGLTTTSFRYGGTTKQRRWVREVYDTDFLDLEVVSIDKDSKEGRELLGEFCSDLRLSLSDLKAADAHDISKAISKAGKSLSDLFSSTFNSELSAIYGRSPQVIGMESNMLTNGMLYNAEIVKTQVGGLDALNSRESNGVAYESYAGNTPLLSLQSEFGALSKSSQLIKTARDDPRSPPIVAEFIGKENSSLKDSMVVVYFPGSDEHLQEIAVKETDQTVAYGGPVSISYLGDICKTHGKKFIEHGPKRTLIYVGQDGKSLGKDVALQSIPFEGQACLSPAMVFVKKSEAEALKNSILDSNSELCTSYPPTSDAFYEQSKDFRWGLSIGAKIHRPIKGQKGGFKVYEIPYDMLDQFSQSEIGLLSSDANYRSIFMVPVKGEAEVAEYLRRAEITSGMPLREQITRMGIYKGDELKGYVSREMPYTVICGVEATSSIGPNDKHDGKYDIAELLKPQTAALYNLPRQKVAV